MKEASNQKYRDYENQCHTHWLAFNADDYALPIYCTDSYAVADNCTKWAKITDNYADDGRIADDESLNIVNFIPFLSINDWKTEAGERGW